MCLTLVTVLVIGSNEAVAVSCNQTNGPTSEKGRTIFIEFIQCQKKTNLRAFDSEFGVSIDIWHKFKYNRTSVTSELMTPDKSARKYI